MTISEQIQKLAARAYAALAVMSAFTVGVLLILPAVATAAKPNSNYCGVVESASGGQVATGFWFTDTDGRRYCRAIHTPANYVCLTAGSRTYTQRETYHADLYYTFLEIIRRPVPDSSSFKPSAVFNPYAVNVGSLSRPVWQSSGAHPAPAEQTAWDAQFGPELEKVFAPGETVTDGIHDGDDIWEYRKRRVRVPGELLEREVTVTIPAVISSTVVNGVRIATLNGDGVCVPDVDANPRYDTLPGTAPPPWIVHAPPVGKGVNEHVPGSFGDATFERHTISGAISTHSDGSNQGHTRFVHGCLADGSIMTTSLSCSSPIPDPPTTTPTIYTCYAQNYITQPRSSDWDPIITTADGPPIPYTSTSPCP